MVTVAHIGRGSSGSGRSHGHTVLPEGIVGRHQAQPARKLRFDQMDSNGLKQKFLISIVDWVCVVGTTRLVGWMSF